MAERREVLKKGYRGGELRRVAASKPNVSNPQGGTSPGNRGYQGGTINTSKPPETPQTPQTQKPK